MTEMQSAVGKARWTRLATLGFLMAAASPLLMLVAGAAFGLDIGEAIGFLAPPIVVLGLVAFLVSRFGTWAKIVGIVLGLAGATFLWWTVFGVFSPNSFFDFVPGLLFTPGALLGIGSCIAALVAKRRGHMTVKAEGGEAKTIRFVLVIVAVLAVLSGVLTIASRSTVSDASAAAATAKLKDFKFHPKEYSVPSGSKILVENNDPFRHTFTVDAFKIDLSLTPGSKKLVEIPATPGSYYLYCSLHAPDTQADATKDDMWAMLVVT